MNAKWLNVLVIGLLLFNLASALELNMPVRSIALYSSAALVSKEQSLNTPEGSLKVFIPAQADEETLIVIDSGASLIQITVGEEDVDDIIEPVEVQLLKANIGQPVELATENFLVSGNLSQVIRNDFVEISNPTFSDGFMGTAGTQSAFVGIAAIASFTLPITPTIKDWEELRDVLSRKYALITESVDRPSRNLEVKYFVNGAGWNPVYHLFLEGEEQAKLFYWAKAFNNTDEDWESVNLQVIAGNPNLKYAAPVYRSKDVYYEEAYAVGAAMPTAADEQFESSASEQLHIYELDRLISLKKHSDSLVPILSQSIPIEKEYKWEADYRNTVDYYIRLVNETDEPLANGWVSVFANDNYVGGNNLPWTQTDANNQLLIGGAPDIKVDKHESVKTDRGPQADVTNRNIKLHLENHKSTAAAIIVSHYLPRDAEAVQSNMAYKDKDNRLEWTVSLAAGESKDITLSYRQTYYHDYEVYREAAPAMPGMETFGGLTGGLPPSFPFLELAVIILAGLLLVLFFNRSRFISARPAGLRVAPESNVQVFEE